MITKSRIEKTLRNVGIKTRSRVVNSGLTEAANLFLELFKEKMGEAKGITTYTPEEMINIIKENKELYFLLVNETFDGIIKPKDK